MSSRDPLWFCHQCHAEMRPLMTPGPVCASCRSPFVEKLENPTDDPRDFQSRAPNIPNESPTAFESLFRPAPWRSSESSFSPLPRSPPIQRAQDNSPSSGLHFEFHTSGPGGGTTRTFILGGPNTLGRPQPQPDRPVPTLSEYLRREPDNGMRAPGDITGQLMAQYLLALFGHEAHGRGDPFAELLGMPPSTRWGDYVFNQEALDQILTQLAENSTAGRPVPATEETVADLPREVLTEGSPLLEKDCAVCKESFKLDAEDPDNSVVVTLPCKHPFHEGCILPWLKSSSTCPVCRFALAAQPHQHFPGGPSGASSGSDRDNASPGSSSRSPGNSDRGGGGGGFFHALFGGRGGASSGRSDGYSTRSQHILRRGSRDAHTERVTRSTPTFPGQWIEDID